jgi:ABC-type sulfate transport system substrate-binding protein
MYISEKTSINVPFTFLSACGTAKEVALLDSRATDNFMDERMVKRLGIG